MLIAKRWELHCGDFKRFIDREHMFAQIRSFPGVAVDGGITTAYGDFKFKYQNTHCFTHVPPPVGEEMRLHVHFRNRTLACYSVAEEAAVAAQRAAETAALIERNRNAPPYKPKRCSRPYYGRDETTGEWGWIR